MKLPALARISIVPLAVAACTSVVPGPSPAPTPSAIGSLAPSGTVEGAPTIEPTPLAVPTASPTDEPTPAATPRPTSTPGPIATFELPPDALIGNGDRPKAGDLGSFCWEGTCADGPQPVDPDELPLYRPSDDTITIRLAEGAEFESWSAYYWTEDDHEPIELGRGDQANGPFTKATFDAPDVDLAIVSFFADFPTGSASYAWAVDVHMPPPAGSLTTGNQNPVVGRTGGYCYDNGCVDYAGFYKSRVPKIAVSNGATLSFSLDGEAPFVYASAGYIIDGNDYESTHLGTGGQDVDPDMTGASHPPLIWTFDFPAPPTGDWVVQVFIRFADRGDASYGWHATVE